jgi:putative ABC transport system substrate-binding protein
MVLLGGALSWPLVARAQQKAIPVIGLLDAFPPAGRMEALDAFREGLGEAGYVDGRNVVVEYRSAENHYDLLPALAADLVGRQITVLVAPSLGAALAAKSATATVPIVFVSGDDPVEAGLVKSFNRPGGNLTGVSMLSTELVPKQLEILSQLVPMAEVFGLLINATGAVANRQSKLAEEAARAIGRRIIVVTASSEIELDAAFAALVGHRVGGVIVGADGFFSSRRALLVNLAARHSVPAIYSDPTFPAAGGLISYDSNKVDGYRQAGRYAGRILDGDNPADLPVMRPDRFQLVINLKTTKALGITVPPLVLARADEVIE